MKSSFRGDIQGLRALAVLAVVIFHYAPYKLSGGFVGVDIFFVISGYLIIGNIVKSMEGNRFSLLDFYGKRIRRLAPAYAVVAFFSLAFAYATLLPEELSGFLMSLASSLLYVSNYYFYSQTGYFSGDSDYFPLLHTWSLSVEEQFYIFFPIILIAASKFLKNSFLAFLCALLIVSFIMGQIFIFVDEELSFFSFHTRAWQFILGGLICLMTFYKRWSPSLLDLLGLLGLLLILSSFIFYDGKTPFPGVYALAPTIGTALIIMAGSVKGWLYRIFSFWFMRKIGDISYSLYLWHWPLIVFYKLKLEDPPSAEAKILLLIMCLFLSFITYFFVEERGKKSKILGGVGAYKFSFLLLACFFVAIWVLKDGAPSRFSDDQIHYSSYLNESASRYRIGTCFLTTSSNFDDFNQDKCIDYIEGESNSILIGDSHAAHWFSALDQIKGKEHHLSQVTASGCRPMLPLSGENRCVKLMGALLTEYLEKYNFNQLIISSNWYLGDSSGLLKLIDEVRGRVNDVVVLGPIITYSMPLPRLLSIYGKEGGKSYNKYAESLAIDDEFKKKFENKEIRYISVLDVICPEGICFEVTDRNIPMQTDYGHTTSDGADFLVKKINKKHHIFTSELHH